MAATAIIALLTVFAFVLIIGLILPAMIDQGQQLVAAIPEAFAWLQGMIEKRFPSSGDQEALLRRGFSTLQEHFKEIGPGLFTSGAGLVHGGGGFRAAAGRGPGGRLLPAAGLGPDAGDPERLGRLAREHAAIRGIMRDIDRTLAGFVRGNCLSARSRACSTRWR